MNSDVVQRQEIGAHRQAHTLSLPDVVGHLRDVLTPKLVAYVGSVSETRATRQWAEGARSPSAEVEVRLRDALHATLVVETAYDTKTAQAWMQGIDPLLDDRSPAWALREGDPELRRAVIASARRFAVQ